MRPADLARLREEPQLLRAVAAVAPKQDRRATVKAVLVAGAVLAAGFGALSVFYSVAPRHKALPGLFHFLSATWGDGVALPVMSGALVFAIGRLPGAQRERLVSLGAGLVGAAVGSATQVQWLRDDSPRLNWTLPRPHHFTAAGTYHAVFLTAMCAITASLWALVSLRLAKAPARLAAHRPAIAAAMVALAAGAVFVGLLVVDSLPGRRTAAGAATVAAVGAGGAVLFGVLVAVAAARVSTRRRQRHGLGEAQTALGEGGTSDRAVDEVAGRYAVVLRCGAVVVAGVAGLVGPSTGVSYNLLRIVLIALFCWAAVFTWIVRRHGLSSTLAVADAVVVLAVLLLQRHLVSAALIADGTSWTIVLASTAVFIPQLILRRPWAGLGVTAAVAAGYWLTEPVLTAGPTILLLQGVVTSALMRLVRRGGRSADAAVARGALAERKERVRAARRIDELEQYRRLHDTILATLTVVASGAVNRGSATLRNQAASDLMVLARLPDLPPDAMQVPSSEPVDLARQLAEITSCDGVTVTFSGSPAQVPAMVAEAITDSVSAALVNVARHAGTSEADVRLDDRGQEVIVTVRDKGRGFDPAAVPSPRRGIRESIIGRMESVGGAALVDSRPGHGTVVKLWWSA